MTRRAAIVGAGSFGKVLAEYLRETLGVEIVGYLDDVNADERCLGPAYDVAALESSGAETLYISIGDGASRLRIAEQYRAAGVELGTYVHPTVTLPSSVSVGAGSVILPGCALMPLSSIGECVYLSIGTGVAHHTVIGDGASLASGARVGAGVTIGPRVSLGVSASVMTGVSSVGEGAVVGAGAVVIRDVDPNTTVVGVPAAPVGQADL